ncbi:MAG: hypothetical protein UH239_05995 [Acutalibacteraceae bacterium]|nr:hypothetical protein [Acutalibacteraceae bacterium]
MYVLVIENQNKRHSGYLVIHDEREYQIINGVEYLSVNMDGESYYIETLDTSNRSLEGEKDIKLIPFGGIAIQQYNSLKDESKKFGIKPPHPSVWFFDEHKKDESDIWNVLQALTGFEPQQVTYIRTASVELGGHYYTLFDVEELQELWLFDLEKIRSLQIPIDVCKYCGHAFVKTSRDVMCSQCRAEKKGEVEKQRRWNESEVNREFAKFTNALRKRSGYGATSEYYVWIGKQRENGTVTVEWLNRWRETDKGFQKLCRFFKNDLDGSHPNSQEWENSYKDFPHKISDPEKWVKEWLEKIKQ